MDSPVSSTTGGALAQAQIWWREGRELCERDRWLWAGMAAISVAATLTLKLIPFAGDLMLLLLVSLPIAGALLAAKDLAQSAPAPVASAVSGLRRAAGALTRALHDSETGMRLALTCIVMLGLVMLAGIVRYFLIGGPLLALLFGAHMTNTPLPLSAIAGIPITLALYAGLLMALHFLVPLVALGSRDAMAAAAESVQLWRGHAKALAIFTAPFVVVATVIVALFYSSATRWLGYLLSLSAGVVAVALFVAGSYCAYRALAPRSGAH